MSAPQQTPAMRRLLARASHLSDRIPTKWLVSSLVGIFLAISAVFGGLNDAPVPPLPTIGAGEAYTGAQLKIAVDRVVLIDGFPEQYIEPKEGNRLLVVIATVENVWDRPVSSYNNIGAADNLRPVAVDGIDVDTVPKEVDILSDGTKSPTLQPGVPVQLAYMWEVADGEVADGDEMDITIFDKVYAPGGYVSYGERFGDPFVAAITTIAVEDVGAGTDPE